MAYPCGVRAGDRLRAKHEVALADHRGQPTGERFERGSLWTVVPGVGSEPSVGWLHQPNGMPHTWDETILHDFEVVARAPEVGSQVVLSVLPDWVAGLPEDSQRLFRRCIGHPLPVDEIDSNGLVVLDASEFDSDFGGQFNDIRVEAELLQSG
jgi:hypothetical protein